MMYANGLLPHEARCPHTQATMRPLFCKDCTADEAYARYMLLKRAYYAGSPLCSDLEFDKYETRCRERWPDDQRFHVVGA